MEKVKDRYNQKPVIFLVFANDLVEGAAYLRHLGTELRGIREALEEARNEGLCEVVERSYAVIDDIFDVFGDDDYKNRIAIFHFGGHANGYQLLLQSLAGGQAPAHREGLAEFMVRQRGLKFVFLNGCSTKEHALELTQTGIPAVVATSQSIKDEVAAELAIRFYKGIANGTSLEKAWLDAEDYIKTKEGTENYRDLYWPGKEEIEDRFPWDIFYKKEEHEVKNWNLPEAARNWLYGLPGIPPGKLPEEPFLFLHRYERKHAEIFFGRSYYIRELYLRVTDKESPPILLLYGQAGVGKSSLLEAGLMPRLEKSHTVCCARRNPQKGLLATLKGVLNDQPLPGKQGGIAETWKRIESETGKPLVVILDQVEEVFTKPNNQLNDELGDFLQALTLIFGDITAYPEGKLILCCRREYHPEIDEKFKNHELDRTPLFMKPLEREDIMDVVTGLTRTKSLRDKYKIKVEKDLPVIIADDLLEDKNTPVAPLLQIILTKMWDTSKKDDGSPDREFKVEQYQELCKNMLVLADFFRHQLGKLRNWNEIVMDSGLALDVLKYHTTRQGTACTRNIRDIRQAYRHSQINIDDLVQQLKDFYLLTDARQEDEISLAHDTLARVVIIEYSDSNRPAQRASRILAAKIEEFKKNKDKIFLDEVDLEIAAQGREWMRAWDHDEEQLVERSRQRKVQREIKRKRNRAIRFVLVSIAVIFALFIAYHLKTRADQSKRSKAIRLAAIAEREVEKNPTFALRLSEWAYQIDKNIIVTETLQEIYRENNFYKIIAAQEDSISCVAFSPDGRYILTGSESEDNKAYLRDPQGQPIKVLEGHQYSVIAVAFSHDSAQILTGSKDRTARLWDLQGQEKKVFEGHNGWVYSVAFSPVGKHVLTGSRDKTARLWDLKGDKEPVVFKGHKGWVYSVAFSPDGKRVLTGSVDNTARLWNLKGNLLQDFEKHEGWVYSAAFSPDGKRVLTGSRDKIARLFDLKGNLLHEFKGHKNVVNSTAFSPGGRYILTGSWDYTARLWDTGGNPLQDFKGHENSVTSAVFSPKGRYIITGSWDKTIRKWSIKRSTCQAFLAHQFSVTSAAYSPKDQYILSGLKDGTVHLSKLKGRAFEDIKVFNGHNGPVTSAAFSADGQYILTGSQDKTARLWDLQGNELGVFDKHKERITSVAFSPDGKRILTASWDNTARLWDLQGNEVKKPIKHEDDVNCAIFSPDGEKILTASWDNTAILRNLQGDSKKKLTSSESLSLFSCAAFSPDGKYILTGSNDGIDVIVRLWDKKGKPLKELTGHKYRISSAAFSPDGKYILTGSWDKTARLWDLQGNELQVFKGHESKVTAVAFSFSEKEGLRVLTGSADKTVRIWEIRMPLKDFLEKGICEEFPEEQLKEKIK